MYTQFKTLLTVLLGILIVATPQVSSAASAVPTITAEGVLAFTNVERIRQDLPILKSDYLLSQVAAKKMADLFARQYFAHEAPTGEDVSTLAKETGYTYITVGENLALGDFTSSKHVVQAWMDSPGHKANILSRSYTDIGIAVGRGQYEGRTVWIAVQSFGLPRSSCPSVDATLRSRLQSLKSTLTILETIATLRQKAYEAAPQNSSSRTTLVALYNRAAALYNAQAEEYRTLASQYNKQVDALNSCIKKKTKK